jgi:ribosomal protein L9
MATKQRPQKRLPRGPHGGIQLLLVHNVDHLGKQGEIVEVKAGYAKNFLIPQGLATLATDHHKRMVEKHRAKLLEIERDRLKGLRETAESRVTSTAASVRPRSSRASRSRASTSPRTRSGSRAR